MSEHKFEKLSRDDETKTKIFVGDLKFTVSELEKEIKSNSEFGNKLKQIEKKLDI